jgi:hypothetical protein
MRARATLFTSGAIALATTLAAVALAQRVDPRRPQTVIVGTSPGPATTARVDAQRTGLARTTLPRGPLKALWRKPLGAAIEHAPLVTDDQIIVVTSRGEVQWLGLDGAEQAKVFLALGATGAPALLADGTIVVVTSGGEAVGVRKSGLRFRVQLGGDRTLTSRTISLALPDGGVVVAAGGELSVLDAEGNVRARATAPEPPQGPLLASEGRILFSSATGVVYGWIAGRDVTRLGGFGGAIDGGMALDGPRTALAIVDGSRLVSLDLQNGAPIPRISLPGGAFLGPPAVRGGVAYMLAMVPGRTFLVGIDGSGQEVMRTLVTSSVPVATGDAGAALSIPSHTGVLVDPTGTVAYAAPEGALGIVDPAGVLAPVADPICTRSFKSGGVAGLAPAGNGTFVVACESGTLARIVGPS